MDPIRQLTSPVAEVRMHAQTERDEYNEQWVMIDGIETKVPSIAAAKVLLAKQDAVRVEIRAALDETGIREKTVLEEITLEDGTKATVELIPPALADVFQIDLERKHVPAYVAPPLPPPPPSRWSRVKRAAKRLFRRKKGRTR